MRIPGIKGQQRGDINRQAVQYSAISAHLIAALRPALSAPHAFLVICLAWQSDQRGGLALSTSPVHPHTRPQTSPHAPLIPHPHPHTPVSSDRHRLGCSECSQVEGLIAQPAADPASACAFRPAVPRLHFSSSARSSPTCMPRAASAVSAPPSPRHRLLAGPGARFQRYAAHQCGCPATLATGGSVMRMLLPSTTTKVFAPSGRIRGRTNGQSTWMARCCTGGSLHPRHGHSLSRNGVVPHRGGRKQRLEGITNRLSG